MFRVTTRADFDGLVCAALLSIFEDVDRYRFIEPGKFQAGELLITSEDLLANLPYRKGCALWFDHHLSNRYTLDFRGSWWISPSAARLVYEYYGAPAEFDELIIETDKIDSAQLTIEDVLEPRDYVLVSMTIDGKVDADEPYWLKLLELLKRNDLRRMMVDSQVSQRCEEYYSVNKEFGTAIKNNSILVENVLVTDLRDKYDGKAGNRFLPFAMFPEINIWVKADNHPYDADRSYISVGHSIFNRSSNVNVGKLLSTYNGGGHFGAGSCRPLRIDSDKILSKIIDVCKNR